jgi:single-stranded-DNA-specific exonuclease
MRWIEPPAHLSVSPLPDLHPLVAHTLGLRGITSPDAARAFLELEAYTPAPSTDLPGMVCAAERIERAILAHEPICVWGDFDVDGQTSTTVLVETLHALGAEVTFHIPVREQESHGINLPHLKEIIALGAKLILTCDTGISACEAVEYASTCNVEMVITDHHDLPKKLPQAVAIVNPKFLPSEHPLASLAGAGVAYKLAEELINHFPSTTFKADSLLDLVALGLVADLAILNNDTRYLVKKGLNALRNTERLGLKVMMEMAGLTATNLTEEHIGFVLGPRLNALGRLSDANPVVELLTTSDHGRARLLATQLENYNIQRQLLCNQVTQAAEAQLNANPSLLQNPVLVLSHPAWPAGVIGIVASHLVEHYHKPALLFSTAPNGPAHGSARSVEGINITTAIAAQKDLLLNFGGHPMAAGLSLDQEHLPEFSRRLTTTIEKMIGGAIHNEPVLRIDAWLDLPEITDILATALESLAPFGPGNRKPILATRNLALQSAKLIGRNKEHLRLEVADAAGISQNVLWWSGAGEPLPTDKVDLAFTVRATNWRGVRQVQMEFVDFRVIEQPRIELQSQKLEIVDYREAKNPFTLLPKLQNQASTLIWAEAKAKHEVGGKDRNELERANNLVIWSIPPSPEELQIALITVKPQKIILVCADPFPESASEYIKHLAGLLKYALRQRKGKVTFSELAAATAQRQITVVLGLNWLVSRGIISLQQLEDDKLSVTSGKPINQVGETGELWEEIQSLIVETAAYRELFKKLEIKNLPLP